MTNNPTKTLTEALKQVNENNAQKFEPNQEYVTTDLDWFDDELMEQIKSLIEKRVMDSQPESGILDVEVIKLVGINGYPQISCTFHDYIDAKEWLTGYSGGDEEQAEYLLSQGTVK